jgi:hypothetical protein
MIDFKVSDRDQETIGKLVDRAMALKSDGRKIFTAKQRMDLVMDLTATHANGNPLRLDDLLQADEFNFMHDIFGIRRHLNRETGELMDCFSPRFSA